MTGMIGAVWIAFTISGLCTTFVIGSGLGKVCKLNLAWYENFCIGFVTILGCVEFFCWYFVAFHMRMVLFEWTAAIIILVLVVIGIKKGSFTIKKGMILNTSIVLAAFVTLFLIVLTQFQYRSDADDSFYVSNVALFQSSSIINPYDSSFGIQNLGTVPMYDFQIWETFMAALCRLFHIEAVTMMHTVSIPILLIFSASAFLMLGGVLTGGNRKKAAYFYVLMTLFHLFGGYAVYSEGSFLLSRLWQGKAVYLTIVLPVMTALILKNVTLRGKYLWLKLVVCMLAGIALNPTSMYVMGFQLLFMVLAVSITEHDKKYLIHMIPSVCSVIFFTICIYFRTSKFNGQMEAAQTADNTFVQDTFNSFWGTGKLYIILFVIAACIIAKWGSKLQRIYIIYTPLGLLAGIWNPWMGRVIAEKVTMVPSYWRVFWLIPVGQGIALALILLYQRIGRNKVLRSGILAVSVMIWFLPGKWMLSGKNGFMPVNNMEKLPGQVIKFGEKMVSEKEDPVVLGCDEFSTTLRQKYVEIELVYSRPQYIWDLFKYRGEQKQAKERNYLREIVNGEISDFSKAAELIEAYGVDYIVLKSGNSGMAEFLEKQKWKKLEQSGGYILYNQ